MKKITLIFGILIACNSILAQGRPDGPPPGERDKVKIEEYKTRLQLSDDQVSELRAMKEKYKPQMEEIRTDESKTRSEKMRAAADVIEKQEAEIASILSEEQLTEWEKIREEVKANREERRERPKERRKGN